MQYRGVRNITIANNRIRTWYRGPAINLGDATDAKIVNNTVCRPPLEGSTNRSSVAAVAVSDVRSVSVIQNVFDHFWGSASAAVSVDGKSSSRVVVANNSMGANIPYCGHY